MKHVIVGTAGHIDHGKTALVKALTGIDTDRLKEEKERGISIELGFAFLSPSPDLTLGIVDVPGHERFVKTMLAGVGGIDLVLLVIGGDEGIMPQTREHLHICELLQVKRGLVALTKADLVEAEWREMVQGEIAQFLQGTFLTGAPVIPVSAVTGQGLPDLVQALTRLAREAPPKQVEGIFRLPIDRVFTMKGFGTVVTGTLWAGTVKVGDEVEILPPGLRARVRRLQTHGKTVETAWAGQRVAVNLPGIEVSEISRGDLLCFPGTLHPTRSLNATLTLLPDARRALAQRARVRFHLGTSEVLARVRLLEGEELAPGRETFVHLVLESPTAALPRDRYVIRTYSPAVTIGGGTILDPAPPLQRRPRSSLLTHLRGLLQGDPQEQIERVLVAAGVVPRTVEELRALTNLDTEALRHGLEALAGVGKIVRVEGKGEQGYLHRSQYAELTGEIEERLQEFHGREPLQDGISKEELRSRFARVPAGLFGFALADLVGRGRIAVDRNSVRLADFRPRLSGDEEAVKRRIEILYREAAFQPPDPSQAMEKAGGRGKVGLTLFHRLVDEGVLVKISPEVYLHREAYEQACTLLRTYFSSHPSITVAAFKELLGISRKHAIPLLEHFDAVRISRREGDLRVSYR